MNQNSFNFLEDKFDKTDDYVRRLDFIADKGQEPMRIDKWIQMRVEGISRSKVQQYVDNLYVSVNNKFVKSNYRIKAGDVVTVITYTDEGSVHILPENIPLNVVYEDDDVLVINKPAKMVSHPGVGNHSGTLINAVAYHLQQQNPNISEDDLPRFGLVHRIDKNTTGLMVLAKNMKAAAHLANQFFRHTIVRKYNALVWGNFEETEGLVNAHIARHPQHRKMFHAFPEGDVGKWAITHYKVLENFYYVSLIECQLETGRTHQIRVHMKHIQHTLFNDWEYGGDKILKGTVYSKYKQFVDNCFEICPRVALHAKVLGFVHPTTGKEIYFESELPTDMQNVIEKWRKYVKDIKIDE